MRKLVLILREALHLVRRNKTLFLLPILAAFAVLAFFVYSLGPVAMLTFLYAGI